MAARVLVQAANRRQRIQAKILKIYRDAMAAQPIPVMSSGAPTITTGGNGTASTVVSGQSVFSPSRTMADPGLTPLGCIIRPNGFSNYIDLGNAPNTVSLVRGNGWGVRGFLSGTNVLDISINSTSGGVHRITGLEGEQYMASADVTVTADSGNRYIKYQWPNNNRRLVEFYFTNSSTIRGLNIGPGGVLEPAPLIGKIRALFLTDSYGFTGSLRNTTAYPLRYAELMGIKGLVNSMSAGTGWLEPSTTKNLFDRRYDAIRMGEMDLIIVSVGLNDRNRDPVSVAARAAAVASYIRETQPEALVFFLLPFRAPLGEIPDALRFGIRDALLRVIDDSRMAIFDAIADQVITGTGYLGATNGSGNSDTLIGPDGFHPTDNAVNASSGHYAYASWLRGKTTAQLKRWLGI